MASNHFTVPTREWAGDAKRTLVQGLDIHKRSGYKIAHQADDVAGQAEQDVVIRAHKPDGSYVGAITLKRVGHGSSIGLFSTGADSMEFWLGSDVHKCVVRVPYKIGDKGVKAPIKTVLPKGDVSIDASEDLLCLRTGDRYRGYRFSDARAGKVTLLWDFTIADWGKRFQGHLIVDGKLFVHRDVETGGASRVHVFEYPSGKPLECFKIGSTWQSWLDTSDMGDEAEGCVEISKDLAERFDLEAGIYAVKRTGGTGPSRVIEASRLPIMDKPAAPKRLHGEDVSSNNVGWKPQPGDTFGFVKSTEGTTYKNSSAPQELDALRSAGKIAMHYHAMWPGNAKEQAAYFVANTDIREGDALWCDWEKWPKAPARPSVEDAAIFIAEVQRLVLTSKVGLYCNRSDWTSTSVKSGDGLWIAEYDTDKPDTSTDWVFWQYTKTPLDRNWCKFTNRADLVAWLKVNREPEPTEAPAEPVVVIEPEPENVGVWAVDPAQVQSVLLGRNGSVLGNELSPGAMIADGVRFEPNSVGKNALLRSSGWSYDASFLVQVGAGPVPVKRQFPIIPDYDVEERIKFRGGLVCRCCAISLPWVEFAMLEAGVIKFNLDFYQFGYRTDVAASAASHAKGQMIDTAQFSDAALKIWRQFGWMMQRREISQGFDDRHGHGGPRGCTHGSTSGPANAASQARAWDLGRDGLAQNKPITGPGPTGKATPRWDTALSAYLKSIGAPPIKSV